MMIFLRGKGTTILSNYGDCLGVFPVFGHQPSQSAVGGVLTAHM